LSGKGYSSGLGSTSMKTTQANLRNPAGRSLALAAALMISSLGPSPFAQSREAMSGMVAPTMEKRSAFATGIEHQLRRAGTDARVQLDGDQRDVLRIEWQGISRHDLYRFVTSSALQSEAPAIGLRSVVFSSGTQQWDYNLATESMVWSSSSAGR
jgi:hypothetical protein